MFINIKTFSTRYQTSSSYITPLYFTSIPHKPYHLIPHLFITIHNHADSYLSARTALKSTKIQTLSGLHNAHTSTLRVISLANAYILSYPSTQPFQVRITRTY